MQTTNISNLIKKNKKHYKIFKYAQEVSEDLNTSVYLVGGYVRDILLKNDLKDIDLMVEENAKLFSEKLSKKLNVNKVIKFEKFHTYRIPYPECEIEVANSRKESYDPSSRKPTKVELTNLEGDLERRDFTINSMAASLSSSNFGDIYDPFNGMQDLNNAIIKTPCDADTTFSDDPLRMLRAIRFACQLDINIDNSTLASIKKQSDRIKIISWERITAELIKILCTKKPSKGFYLLQDTNLLTYVFPELCLMPGVEVIDGKSHKDVFIHTLEVVDNAAQLTDKMEIRFAALVHDIAKPQTKRFFKDKGWTFHGHEEIGKRMLVKVAQRMKLSSNLRDYLMILTKLHLRPIALAKKGITDKAVRRVMFEAGEYIDDLMVLCRADITTKNPKKVKKYMNNFEKVEDLMQDVKMRDEMRAFKSPIDGHIIMKEFKLTEGREIGNIKTQIEEAILDGIIDNNYDAAYKFMLTIKRASNSK